MHLNQRCILNEPIFIIGIKKKFSFNVLILSDFISSKRYDQHKRIVGIFHCIMGMDNFSIHKGRQCQYSSLPITDYFDICSPRNSWVLMLSQKLIRGYHQLPSHSRDQSGFSVTPQSEAKSRVNYSVYGGWKTC